MKRLLITAIILCVVLTGCAGQPAPAQIAATTLPVYEFTTMLCRNTDLQVCRLVTESVSCLHDYTLQVSQMKALGAADAVIVSGAGLEDFLGESLVGTQTVIDASDEVTLLCHEDTHNHDHDHDHVHEHDPHIWLSPVLAKQMAQNICRGLTATYPAYTETFATNLITLESELDRLYAYGQAQLSNLSSRELVTFHDGFAYLADAFGLTILHAIEEESGSEASAGELIELITLVQEHKLGAVFTEQNGSVSAASVIAGETGADIFQLDMAMSGESYFEAMYHNIDTLKEALE